MRRIPKIAGSPDRCVPAEKTAEALLSRMNLYGITRVTEITGLDDLGIPVHAAVRPRSVSTASVHAGKGLTAADSLASALAEAVELDCAERFDPEERVRGSYRRIRGSYPAFRPRWGVPGAVFSEELSLDWVWVTDLLRPTQGRQLLPLEFIRQGSFRRKKGRLFDVRMSEGVASGNVLEEAVLHGINELVERDAASIFLFRGKYLREDLRRKYFRIRLDTLPPVPARLADRILRAGRRISLLNVTSDVGIPVVLCSISGAQGAGASLDAERAVVRAITEAAQTSTVNVQGAREDLDPALVNPRVYERNFGYDAPRIRELFDDLTLPEIAFETMPSKVNRYIDQDISDALALLREAGIRDAFACDISDEHCVGFRAVRVVIPELELMRLDTIGPRRLRHIFS